MKKYAGIGARKTPLEICRTMYAVGRRLAELDHLLRSGGAIGADLAFEDGAVSARGATEIYLIRQRHGRPPGIVHMTPAAIALAQRVHPAWHKLGSDGRLLMARNGFQLLGRNLDDPVSFVICYTEYGQPIGGTSQAIRLAALNRIPLLNLGAPENRGMPPAAIVDWATSVATRPRAA